MEHQAQTVRGPIEKGFIIGDYDDSVLAGREGGVGDMIHQCDKAISRLDNVLSTLRASLSPVLAPDQPTDPTVRAMEAPIECDYATQLRRLLGNLTGMADFIEDLSNRLRL